MILRILLLLSATLLSAHEMTHSYEYLRELIFHGEGKMEIKQGSKNYLEISADPALLGNIEILDKQGVLTIHPTSADFKAKLTVKHLEKITLFGTPQIDIDELKGERFVIIVGLEGAAFLEGNLYFDHLITNLYGSGQVSLQGKVKTQTIFLKGDGKYAGQNLKSEKANVIIRGPGTVCVWSAEELNTSIQGSGHVYFVNHQAPPKILKEAIEGNKKVSAYSERIMK